MLHYTQVSSRRKEMIHTSDIQLTLSIYFIPLFTLYLSLIFFHSFLFYQNCSRTFSKQSIGSVSEKLFVFSLSIHFSSFWLTLYSISMSCFAFTFPFSHILFTHWRNHKVTDRSISNIFFRSQKLFINYRTCISMKIW